MSATLPHVAFVCTRNSCRSQMAEAAARVLAADVFDAYSAGTDPALRIDEGALLAVRRRYGYDMELTGQWPKALDELPQVDVLITMGCGVECPAIPAARREDWGLPDPAGRGEGVCLNVLDQIETNVRRLCDVLA